jgi:hypothetical protein
MNQDTSITRAKPKLLREITLLMCALQLVPLLWIEGALPSEHSSGFALFGIVSGLWLLVVWFFWQGRNWPRIVVLVFSALTIPNIIFEVFAISDAVPLLERTKLEQAVAVVDMLLSVFLLYWLNTKPVKEFFKPVQPATPVDVTRPPIPEP